MSNSSDHTSNEHVTPGPTPSTDAPPVGKKMRAFRIMLGTEGTGEYGRPWIETDWMRLGVREYIKATASRPGQFRVRIEVGLAEIAVLNAFFPRSARWKQPGDSGQRRYSTTVVGDSALRAEFEAIISPLFLQTIGFDAETDIGPDAPRWFRDLIKTRMEAAPVDTKASEAGEPEATASATQDLNSLSQAELFAIARAEHVQGANSRWGVEALRRNILAKRAKLAGV